MEEQKTEKRRRGRPPKTEEQKKRQEAEKEKNIQEDLKIIGAGENQKIRKNELTGRKVAELAEKIAKRYMNPDLRNNTNPDIERFLTNKEKIRTVLSQSLYWYNMPPCKTEEDFAERLDMFFARILETGEVPTMERLALALGTTTDTLMSWIDGRVNTNPAIFAMIKKARQLLSDMESACAASGDMPQVVWIFRSKNYYGMQDKTETVITNRDSIQEQSEEELQNKYKLYRQAIPENE